MPRDREGFNAGPTDEISGPQTQAGIGRYEAARGLPQLSGQLVPAHASVRNHQSVVVAHVPRQWIK